MNLMKLHVRMNYIPRSAYQRGAKDGNPDKAIVST